MEREFVPKEELERCRKVAKAYEEYYNQMELAIVDAGRYGFVKLQYYSYPKGFDAMETYTDSREMFEDLWDLWLNTQIFFIVKGTPLQELDYEDALEEIPKEKKKEFLEKKKEFALKAEIILD